MPPVRATTPPVRPKRVSAARSAREDDWEPANIVALTGRLSADPTTRALPSGDDVVSLRIVVPRKDGRSDSFDCSAWSAVLRRKTIAWHEGDVVELSGGLRRRFWRTATGPASRWEIEISSARRVVRAQRS